MRVFDCKTGEYIPLEQIKDVWKWERCIELALKWRPCNLFVHYASNEQRDAAFRDAFDVVGKTRT